MTKLTHKHSLLAIGTAIMLAGCAANNPYEGERNVNRTAVYGGIGAAAGAITGAAVSSKKDRTKGALIGAAVAGAAGAGYGYYVDRQEEQLRAAMQGTGVEVQRDGDNLTLVMPGNVTFATDSSTISGSFYGPLNDLARSFREYDQNTIEIVGHTDSTGAYQYNMDLSRRRAQSVASYLQGQGVPGSRMNVRGMGPDQPVASNADAYGRQQNRRVEINLRPIPGAYQ